MGNSNSSSSRRRSASPETAADRAKKMVSDFQSSVQSSVRKFDEDHPAAQLIDTICAPIFDDDKLRSQRTGSYAYSEDYSEDDSRTISEDDTLDEYDRRRSRRKKEGGHRSESSSMMSQSDYESDPSKRPSRRGRRDESDSQSQSFDSEEDRYTSKRANDKSVVTHTTPDVGPGQLSKPLASSFAKRCYFTKAGIGKTTQHYEGLTLTGNVVLMLAAAMKLKGCPTICDEDLRRVEQTYPNQFSRLPDELLLSSGWRRISKYCHFSNKPIPDGVPFFHSKKRAHPSGGYYFLLAAAVGMIRPIDVEPLTRDTLVLLETDYPTQCDAAPTYLIENPNEWTLVDKFCFFSGGPINQEEDVYYQADFDANPIYMLAFLSPSLTPEELYKLNIDEVEGPGLKTVAAVEEVESVYDLTERDFDDLKLYHLGPCRALPPYILQPQAWRKVLPPHFLAARHNAMMKAQQWEDVNAAALNQHTPGAAQVLMSPDHHVPSQQPHFDYTPSMAEDTTQFVNQDWGQHQIPHPTTAVQTLPDDAPSPGYFQQSSQHGLLKPYASENQTFETQNAPVLSMPSPGSSQPGFAYYSQVSPGRQTQYPSQNQAHSEVSAQSFKREMEEEGAFVDSSVPIDEALALRQMRSTAPPSPTRSGHVPLSPPGYRGNHAMESPKLDPPDDEPPSLSKHESDENEGHQVLYQDEYIEETLLSTAHDTSYEESSTNEHYEAASDHYEPSPTHQPFQHAIERNEYQASEAELNDYYNQGPDVYESPSRAAEESPGYGTRDGYYESPENETNVYDNGKTMPYEDSVQAETEYYVSPEKSDMSNPAYSAGEEEYYPSPVYTEETGFSTGSLGRGDNFVSSRDDNLGIKVNGSPKSEVSRNSSEYTPTSAMRTAQDLLRKNRQKRLELAMRRQHGSIGEENGSNLGRAVDDSASQATWDSGSEMTSVISGSSVWTDSSNAADRSSRRALILQMAKARMKSNKSSNESVHANEKITATIAEETSISSTTITREHDLQGLDETRSDVKTDIDLGGDLD